MILHVKPYKNSISNLNIKEKHFEENVISVSESETGTFGDSVLNIYSKIYYEFIIIGNDVNNQRKKLLKKF